MAIEQQIYYKSLRERNKLVIDHISIISIVVKRISNKLPNSIDKKDLFNIGAIGLIESANKFNPEKNSSFKSFAQKRIHGAIYDELRKQNLGGQNLCKKIQKLEKAIKEIEEKTNKKASDIEIASFLGISIKKLNELYLDISNSFLLHFDDFNESQDIKIIPKNNLIEDFEDKQIQLEQKYSLIKAIKKLTEKEQKILQLYYYHNLSFKEISIVLNISNARVSQIHSKIILILRGRLKP